MKKRIYNIGSLGYLWTILFGKSRTVNKMVIETENEDKTTDREELQCDYIVTIGRKSVVVTTLGENGKASSRKPIIVAPWKKMGVEYDSKKKIKMTFYQDIDGFYWMYLQDKVGQAISMYNEELTNQSIHLEFR
jgi:hypothetical protein